ncbi:peptidase S8 and S53 subtilisin kexin sedolisin [Segetibacter sp. 3557_3]|uniref:S8 family peptidase n=1 Tax=Segetibacter sp. 3557_3 TaxID=2547429 RepID=UPI001058EE69|nr:S8 family serine peptidase [Segetibacter sp. 3557_3]TDH26998.1 peptidase S8 and S53 subtilisin kexin sedolisin [Segetibacter sp. 3557_3]
MHFKNTTLATLAIFLMVTSCTKTELTSAYSNPNGAGSTARSAAAGTSSRGSANGNYLVICKTPAVSKKVLDQVQSIGTVTRSLAEFGVVLAKSTDPDFASTISQVNEVESVVPDLEYDMLVNTWQSDKAHRFSASAVAPQTSHLSLPGLTGSNSIAPLQWNLKAVNAHAAFASGYKGAGAVVAVLDGGFYMDNPDLAPNILVNKATSFIPGESAQYKYPTGISHGTHVAGIIAAADNDYGIVGIAPAAKLMLVKVLSDDGWATLGTILSGIYYAANNGADIISMSLGGFFPRNDHTFTPDFLALNRAFQYAKQKGVVSIAAVGNSSLDFNGQGQLTVLPASSVNVIAISATGPLGWGTDQNTSLFPPAVYTNFGTSLIDFAAPGGNTKLPQNNTPVTIGGLTLPVWIFDEVVSDGKTGEFVFMSGTSMAAPAAAGVAALIVGKHGGNISPVSVENKMKASAVDMGAPGNDDYYGRGHVNAGNAVQQ